VSLAVFLPPQLISHVRNAFAKEAEFFVATSWQHLAEIIQHEPLGAIIVDPAADGVLDVDAVAGILHRFPSLPVVGYVMLTPTSFGAIAELSRRGLKHVVLHRFADSRERLVQTVTRVRGNPPSDKVLGTLGPVLKQVPLALSRAISDMFDRPHRYLSVLDLATAAHMPAVSVYRYLEAAKLGSPKKLLVAAKLSRGLSYLHDPGYSIQQVARKLGYRYTRIFSAHVIEVFDLTPSRVRSRMTEEDAMAHLIRWIDLPDSTALSRHWPR
jgi:AraC-like DNA-binding protein